MFNDVYFVISRTQNRLHALFSVITITYGMRLLYSDRYLERQVWNLSRCLALPKAVRCWEARN